MHKLLRLSGSPNEIDTIEMLEKTCFSDPWTRQMIEDAFESDYVEIWAAFEDDSAIGYYCAEYVAGQGDIMSICVLPEKRGKGLGAEMLRHCEERAVKCGVEELFLEVRVSNSAARRLYSAAGFNEIWIRRGYYSDGEDAIVMKKQLK